MHEIKIIVGGSLDDDGTAFVDAWRRAEKAEDFHERSLVFESWELLAGVMTGERFRLLDYVHAHPEPSISAPARSLGHQYRRVLADVAALEMAGLPAHRDGSAYATADRLKADIRL